MFGLVFGISIFAVSAVLTASMAGLSLGSLYFGRRVDTYKSPLKLFACLEIAIGGFALLFPFLISQLTHIYLLIHQHLRPSLYLSSLIKFSLAFPLLFIPTALMGGTLPVLSKFFVKEVKELGWNVGSLYSVNNWGAVVGCLGAGFFLIQAIGVRGTLYLAALVNISIGLISLGLSRHSVTEGQKDRAHVKVKENEKGGEQIYSTRIIYLVLSVFVIEGFISLAYEVIWIRLLVFFLGSTTYAFTTMVASFICGLALGGFCMAKFIDRKKDLLSWFASVEISIGLCVILLLPVLGKLSNLMDKMPGAFAMSWASIGIRFMICFLIMLVPTTLMGATFPLVGKLYARNLKNLGRRIGSLGCLDTIGSILGAFAGGFILIPFIGIERSVRLLAFLNIVMGAMIIFFHPFMKAKVKGAIALGLVNIIVIVNAITSTHLKFTGQLERTEIREILYYKEGASATVRVFKINEGKKLDIDGYTVAGTTYSAIEVQKSLAHFPLLLHMNPKRVLIIGFGAGGTSWSVSQHDVEETDCVELIPEVIEAAAHFPSVNHGILKDPEFNLVIEDGRNYLLTTNKTYDVITVDATSPKLAGNGNLYTQEFYELCKRSLAKEGVICQWLPHHLLTEGEILMILRTFSNIFPHSSLWFTPYRNYYLLIGTQGRLTINFKLLEQRMEKAKIKDDLETINLNSPYAFISCFAMDENGISRHTQHAEINTDNHPSLEYFTFSAREGRSFLFGKREGLPLLTNIEEANEENLAKYFQAAHHFLLGRIYSQTDLYEETFYECSKGLALIPQDGIAKYLVELSKTPLVWAYFLEASNCQNAGSYDMAIKLYKRALEIDPQFEPARLALKELEERY